MGRGSPLNSRGEHDLLPPFVFGASRTTTREDRKGKASNSTFTSETLRFSTVLLFFELSCFFILCWFPCLFECGGGTFEFLLQGVCCWGLFLKIFTACIWFFFLAVDLVSCCFLAKDLRSLKVFFCFVALGCSTIQVLDT